MERQRGKETNTETAQARGDVAMVKELIGLRSFKD